jgi:SSS family solute:Na+ symporter
VYPGWPARFTPSLLIGVISAGAVVSNVTRDAFPQFESLASYGYGVPPWLGSLVICLVVLAYVFFGGMRGTAWANAFQTAVFMILGVITFVTMARGLGGTDSFLADLQRATQAVDQAHLSRIRIPKAVYFSFLLIPLSVAMFPHVFQHWLTARSANSFKLPIVLHPIFIMIVWVPCVLIGAWASAPSAGLPEGIAENAVLATMVAQLAGPLLGGLLTAGVLAAIMSSLDSQFLCLGTIFTNDIVRHYFGEDRFTEKQTVIMARAFVVAIVAATYVFSLMAPRNVFDLSIWCFSGFVGLFPLVLAAIYWRRLTEAGSAASILTTIIVWGLLFYRSGFGLNTRYAFPEAEQLDAAATGLNGWGLSWLAHALDAIPPLMPVVSVFIGSAIALIAVSLLTNPPDKQTLGKFFCEEDK